MCTYVTALQTCNITSFFICDYYEARLASAAHILRVMLVLLEFPKRTEDGFNRPRGEFLRKRKKKKCWYRSTHTSCIHSEIQQHKHYQFCRCFSGWGPKPVLVLCSRCFSHPAQIWTQVSSIWKQEETPLALTYLQNPPHAPFCPRTWPWRRRD